MFAGNKKKLFQENNNYILGEPSNHKEYAKVDNTNLKSSPSYTKKNDTEKQSNDTELDNFGFWYVEGKIGFGNHDEEGNIFPIENAKAIFREIEKERMKKQANEDLLFNDHNSISVANSSSKLTILDFE